MSWHFNPSHVILFKFVEAMNHGKKLAVTVACGVHLKCTEGKLEPAWKVDKPVEFHCFREKLAL